MPVFWSRELTFFPLQGREVLLATEDGFLSAYVGTAFRMWGIKVGPTVVSAHDLAVRIDTGAMPIAACVSVNLPGLSFEEKHSLSERGIPFILVGIPNPPPALLASMAMVWPFSAFQLATDLSKLVTRRAEVSSQSSAIS